MVENRFNLIDEPWVPVADAGLVSLCQLFEDSRLRSLVGTPVQKIAVTKLLLAICQSACTPEDDEAWQRLGAEGLAGACLQYLGRWYDSFYLYGERPFLQMKEAEAAEIKPFGAVRPEVAIGNTSRLTEYHIEKTLDNSQKALLLITQMSMALGGKRPDNKVVLSKGYKGKTNKKGNPTSAKPGPGLGARGFLHSFAVGASLQQTLWFNLLTTQEIQEIGLFSKGIGQAPWEKMPQGEDCDTARSLKESLMGRLVPLCRFCLIVDKGLHLTEGLHHLSHKEGLFDPSITVKPGGKEPEAIWTDPERRPWRELTALLGFLSQENGKGDCYQLKYSLTRASRTGQELGIWSGGLRVTNKAGEQYVSGTDDALESKWFLPEGAIRELWFERYTQEMDALEKLAKKLWGSVRVYYKTLKKDGKGHANSAELGFWQLCEREAQRLLYTCDRRLEVAKLRRLYAAYMYQTYDRVCPNETARQLDAWAKCRPSVGEYLELKPAAV